MTIWADAKQRWEQSEEKVREEKIKEEKVRESQKKEDAGAQKGRKVARHPVFSNVFWLQRVEKYARSSGGRGAMWPDGR